VKIVGAMRLHRCYSVVTPLTLPLLDDFCDELIILREPGCDQRILDTVAACKKVVCTVEYRLNPVFTDHFRQGVYWLAHEYQADWLVICDQDEILPYDKLRGMLTTVNEKVIMFPFITCLGDVNTIVDPQLEQTGSHGRIYRGNDYEFHGQDKRGFCVPARYWAGNTYQSRYPTRHLRMLTPELQEIRRVHACGKHHAVDPWVGTTPQTFPFKPDMTLWEYIAWTRAQKA